MRRLEMKSIVEPLYKDGGRLTLQYRAERNAPRLHGFLVSIHNQIQATFQVGGSPELSHVRGVSSQGFPDNHFHS